MSIERDVHDEYVIGCDGEGCDDQLFTHTEDFRRAIDMVKVEGWKVMKEVGGQWVHLCPSCR